MVTGPKLAELLGVTRDWINKLTVRELIAATKVDTPKGFMYIYDDKEVARLKKDGLPTRKRKESNASH